MLLLNQSSWGVYVVEGVDVWCIVYARCCCQRAFGLSRQTYMHAYLYRVKEVMFCYVSKCVLIERCYVEPFSLPLYIFLCGVSRLTHSQRRGCPRDGERSSRATVRSRDGFCTMLSSLVHWFMYLYIIFHLVLTAAYWHGLCNWLFDRSQHVYDVPRNDVFAGQCGRAYFTSSSISLVYVHTRTHAFTNGATWTSTQDATPLLVTRVCVWCTDCNAGSLHTHASHWSRTETHLLREPVSSTDS